MAASSSKSCGDAGKPSSGRSASVDFQELVRRCEALDILHNFDPGIDAELARIDAAKKTSSWKLNERDKLRRKIERQIALAHLVQMNKLKAEFPQRKAESEQHWLERLRRRGEKRQRAAALAATPAAAPPAAAPLAAIAPPAVAPVVAAPPAWYVPGWRSRSYEEIREAELLQRSGGEIQASPTSCGCRMCGQAAHGDCGCMPEHVLLGLWSGPGPGYEPCCPSDPSSPCYDSQHSSWQS